MAVGTLIGKNKLVTEYFGDIDSGNYFTVDMTAYRPQPAGFEDGDTIKIKEKPAKKEKKYTIIYSEESYNVQHSHSWGDGGLGNMIKTAVDSTIQSTAPIISSYNEGGLNDSRSQFNSFDVPQVFKNSQQRSMTIKFLLFRYEEDDGKTMMEQISELRDLTYPKKGDKGQMTGSGNIDPSIASFRIGTPPCLWKVTCSNNAQGLKKAICDSMDVQYHGPWTGKDGLPTYATVSMNFRSVYQDTFVEDFYQDKKE